MGPSFISETQIASILYAHLGAHPLQLIPASDGQRSAVWEAVLPDRTVIVRIHEDPKTYASTEHNLMTLTELGLPVPRVLASDISGLSYPFGYLILEKIHGRDLRHELSSMTEAQMSRLAGQIAGFQRTVGTLPRSAGFGWVGIGECGPYDSWWNLLYTSHDTAAGLKATVNDLTLQRQLLWVMGRLEPYLKQVKPTCFLDDLTVKNVLVSGGELQGLVDFDCVCYGDPLHWLGLTATVVVCDIGIRELFYVDELIRFLELTPIQRNAAFFYSALISLGFVERYAASESPAWGDRMNGAIESWLTELEKAIRN